MHTVVQFIPVAPFIRDTYDSIQTHFDPNFVSPDGLEESFHLAGAILKSALGQFTSALKDIVLLRPLTNWIQLPGLFQGHFNPFFEPQSAESYDLGIGRWGLGFGLYSGFYNGMWLSFPSSPSQLYALVALFIWGLPAFVFALAGWACGVWVGFIPILLGWEWLFNLWQNYEMVPVLFNIACTAYLSVHLWVLPPSFSVRTIQWDQKRLLARRFWLAFFGANINLGSILPNFSHLSANPAGSSYIAGEMTLPFFYHLNMLFYFIGLAMGLVFWGCVSGYLIYRLYRAILFMPNLDAALRNDLLRARTYFFSRWVCVILMNLGSVFALTWVGVDAMTYGNGGFLYHDRAIPDFKRGDNTWNIQLYQIARENPWDIDLSPEEYKKYWEFMTLGITFDFLPYNDDYFVNNATYGWFAETDMDVTWQNRYMGRLKADEKDELPFMKELRMRQINAKQSRSYTSTRKFTQEEGTEQFGQDKRAAYQAQLQLNRWFVAQRMYFNDYFVPRLNREDSKPSNFVDKTGFLSEVMRGVFRYDTAVALLDRNASNEVDVERYNVKSFRDWRARWRNNPLYRLTFPSVEWVGTKFRSDPRHKLNVNQSYHVAQRRSMLMNYLSFLNVHEVGRTLRSQSMSNRAYNHQFRGNMNLVGTWDLFDVHYAQRYELVRQAYMNQKGPGRGNGNAKAPPWYDIPQRAHVPWYEKDGLRYKTTPPDDYNIVPSMVYASSVASFDAPSWNRYPSEAKHALHEELWPCVQAETEIRSLPYQSAHRNASEGQPSEGKTYGEKIKLIEHWFRPDKKHAEAMLDHFQRIRVDPAPMYVGWDNHRKKMLVRQARLPNFVEPKANLPQAAERPEKPKRQKLKPVWFRFAAWAPNGVNVPSQKQFYRTFELNASTMELQRFASTFDLKNPLESFDLAVGKQIAKDPDSDLRQSRVREQLRGEEGLQEGTEAQDMSDTSFTQDENQSQGNTVRELVPWYHTRHNVINRVFTLAETVGWARPDYQWTDNWNVLKRLPQVDLTSGKNELQNDALADDALVILHDYTDIGYTLPPGLGGIAWPGSFDVRILPDGVREQQQHSLYRYRYILITNPLNYVLDSDEFDMRGLSGVFDLGVTSRRWEDDLDYFENAPGEGPNWRLAPADFERLYETYQRSKSESANQAVSEDIPEASSALAD